MKILHLCLANFYIDNYSYQENMLPKYHKELGYEVIVISSLQTFDKNGSIAYMQKEHEYQNEYDIPVIRLDYQKPQKVYRKLKRFVGTYESLEKINPDILFIHGCQFLDIDAVVQYLKMNPNVKVFVDNHADFSNSAQNWVSLNILHKILWKHCAHKIQPYTEKFYGVLPARVDFLKNIYELKNSKTELLVMGADDDLVIKARMPKVKNEIRKKYDIKENDFLIVTGGKIDLAKRQTILLMEAVKKIDNPKLKLLVFGSITKELKNNFENFIDSKKIQYIGWINSEDAYKHFAAADLVCFPGRHSVFWEQTVGLGIPGIFKYWEGTTHIDLGGNCKFLYEDNTEEIMRTIQDIVQNKQEYQQMKEVAEQKGMQVFSYKEIAKRSIEME